ncbi:TPA: hypothetical protein ACS7W8_001484 [Providencia alcalifaciens]|uniref:hypothetical protein n=1 Tax=Providencia sp. PROV209 TaxID=2949906 RepID=UPI00234B14A7|nr:hypothetical protein [Providencia sp. PROV209]
MLRPQSKGQEILDTIAESMLSGELKLFPIQVMGIKREIERLADIALKLHLKGIMAILQGVEIEEGMSLCERAIKLDQTNPSYWNNYIVTLRNAGLHQKHNAFIEESSHLINYHPKMLGYELFMLGVYSLRIELIDAAVSILEKMGISIDDIGLNTEGKVTAMLMRENASLIEQFRPMVDCLLDIVERQYKGSPSTLLKKDSDGTMTYIFRVNLDLDKVSDLNEQLFESLYDKGLLSSDCCIYIEPGRA